jgi:hypothetical protein
MYKIPNIPNMNADINEIADFIEVECIKNKNISAREIISALDRLDDHSYQNGVPEDDPLEIIIQNAINEIDQRNKYCGNRYPFAVGMKGHVITLDNKIDEVIREIYTFLLFTTRLNMQEQKIQDSIDGSLLFEELSLNIGRYYLGNRADSFLFGTSCKEPNFEKRISSLIKKMEEMGGFKNRNEASPNMIKDNGLDVVFWKPFSDNLPGKIIGFGQCKTGTNWKDKLTTIQPDSFCKKWFSEPLAVDPVRFFFISESILRANWYRHSVDAGILFDRCRIMDYLPMGEALPFLTNIKSWNNAVKASLISI